MRAAYLALWEQKEEESYWLVHWRLVRADPYLLNQGSDLFWELDHANGNGVIVYGINDDGDRQPICERGANRLDRPAWLDDPLLFACMLSRLAREGGPIEGTLLEVLI